MVPLRTLRGVFLLALAVLVIGCADRSYSSPPSKPATRVASKQSLYERLGGTSAITPVVDQFVANVAADQRINGRFATTDIPRLKQNLVDQICSASGGPCVYRGRDMKTTHAGMKITTTDFNALVEDLVAALNKFKVPAPEQNELLGLLGPLKKDIVEVP